MSVFKPRAPSEPSRNGRLHFWSIAVLVLGALVLAGTMGTPTGSPSSDNTENPWAPSPPRAMPLRRPLLGQGEEEPPPQPFRAASGWELLVYPVGPWYVGDLLGWDVRPPQAEGYLGQSVTVHVDPPHGPSWEGTIRPHGFERIPSASFFWVWDTTSERPGLHRLEVRYQNRTVLEFPLILLPAASRPESEARIQWAQVETPCCSITYFTHTETERDLTYLHLSTDLAAREISRKTGMDPEDKPSIVFMPRLWGQGGFMSGEMWVSYRDRGPLKDPVIQIVRHEMVHWMERNTLKNWRPSMLVEGMAVYLSGGHFRPREPLLERAHALMQLDMYLPLPTLAHNFYLHQHEAAYMQAAALVAYMVERWGWAEVWDFYTTLEAPKEGETQPQALSRQLQARFGLTLEELDEDFRMFLGSAHVAAPLQVEDVRLTLALYDSLRAYQKTLDPWAYFGTAWIPWRERLEPPGAVAPVVRSPNTLLHQVAELLLQQASLAWLAGEHRRAETYLNDLNTLVQAVRAKEAIPWGTLPQADSIRAWVAWAQSCRGEIQVLDLHGGQPLALVTSPQSRPHLEIWLLPTEGKGFRCPSSATVAYPGPWLPRWRPASLWKGRE